MAFEQMATAFDARVQQLQGVAALRSLPDDELADALAMIAQTLDSVEASFDTLSAAVEAETQCLEHADAVARQADEQAALLARITAALSTRSQADGAAAAALAPRSTNAAAVRPQLGRKPLGRKSLARKPAAAAASGAAARPKSAPTKAGRKSLGPMKAAPMPDTELQHVTAEELDGLRKDQKGRLTAEKMNAGIDDLRELLSTKRQLLATKRTKLKHGDDQRVKDWQELITDETEGFAFFTEDDLLDPPTGKPSPTMVGATGKSMISALRGLARVKEVRVNRTKVYLLL